MRGEVVCHQMSGKGERASVMFAKLNVKFCKILSYPFKINKYPI